MREFERLHAPDGLSFARVTYEFLRPVPLGDLQVQAEVVRPGRRVQLIEASLRTPDGVEVVRARALRVHSAQAPSTERVAPPGPPDSGRDSDFRSPYRPMFAPDSIEIRFVSGGFHNAGEATGWFRLRRPLVDGEPLSPLQRLAAAADFGNGISSPVSWEEYVFINPDLTVYIEREPQGEWICLDARTTISSGGIGVSHSTLYDSEGMVGRATQALVVSAR
jgi:hypothetical protein